MRRDMTYAETLLLLRRDALGVRFRRREPIGPFIADFGCLRARIIVETDGWSHRFEKPVTDEDRDRWFADRGWAVLRFDDNDVWRDLAGVVSVIASTVHERLNR